MDELRAFKDVLSFLQAMRDHNAQKLQSPTFTPTTPGLPELPLEQLEVVEGIYHRMKDIDEMKVIPPINISIAGTVKEYYTKHCYSVEKSGVRECEATQHSKDPLYTLSVIQGQLGDIHRRVCHDPTYNPRATPYGSENDEKSTIGETIIHLLRFCLERGFNPQECIDLAGKRLFVGEGTQYWDQEVVETKERNNDVVAGLGIITDITPYSLKSGYEGKVFVLMEGNPEYPESSINEMVEMMLSREIEKVDIVVCEHFSPSLTPLFDVVAGIITDYGSRTCHASIQTIEWAKRGVHLAVIVGTGEATKKLEHNSSVRMDLEKGTVEVL